MVHGRSLGWTSRGSVEIFIVCRGDGGNVHDDDNYVCSTCSNITCTNAHEHREGTCCSFHGENAYMCNQNVCTCTHGTQVHSLINFIDMRHGCRYIRDIWSGRVDNLGIHADQVSSTCLARPQRCSTVHKAWLRFVPSSRWHRPAAFAV